MASSELVPSLLVILFVYTAFSKLGHVRLFKSVLEGIPFISSGAIVLVWAIPLAELFIALLLVFPITRLGGLYASLILLSVFTGYLIYLVSFVSHLPCSCGGVISAMSWPQHVVFNLVFIGLTIIGIRNTKKERPYLSTGESL